ncbi:MAG: hypothetical protein KF858_00020 [Candidatus Sumerlaeia bacterium]|nr:hypothetical protein [Candidatus Sumerlaeia bacterium]
MAAKTSLLAVREGGTVCFRLTGLVVFLFGAIPVLKGVLAGILDYPAERYDVPQAAAYIVAGLLIYWFARFLASPSREDADSQ